MRPDTFTLRLGHYILLPLVLLLRLVRHYRRRQFDFTVGWVFTTSGKVRYTTFGPIRLVKE